MIFRFYEYCAKGIPLAQFRTKDVENEYKKYQTAALSPVEIAYLESVKATVKKN